MYFFSFWQGHCVQLPICYFFFFNDYLHDRTNKIIGKKCIVKNKIYKQKNTSKNVYRPAFHLISPAVSSCLLAIWSSMRSSSCLANSSIPSATQIDAINPTKCLALMMIASSCPMGLVHT
jgi:hypothetical protein